VPTKRRRIGARALMALTPRRREFLGCGRSMLAGREPRLGDFEDENEARAAWTIHREDVLAEWDRPGRRPWALWMFDYQLEPAGPSFVWPAPYQSESELVHAMLKAGELAPCRRSGIHRISSELTAIEEDWQHWLAICRMHHAEDPAGAALQHYGAPRWFRERRK
jgi:hypothetical protein